MLPAQTIIDRLATLLATDATTIAHATLAVKVHLAMAAFVPSASLLIGGVTEATFTGYAALLGAVGAQQNFLDPLTGKRIVQLVEPAGGWHWATTAGTGLPMTIYGYYVTDNGSATLYSADLLPTPVTLTATGQGVDVGQVRFALALVPLT